MEKQIRMSSFELELGAPLARHSVILQQHPGWQNPEYSHHRPKTLTDPLNRAFLLVSIFNSEEAVHFITKITCITPKKLFWS